MLRRSAKDIENLKTSAGGGLNLPDLIIELWKQVDDLNNEVRSHKQKIGRLEDKTGVSSGVGSTGRMSKD